MEGDTATEAPIRFLVLGTSGNTGSRIARLLLTERERARVVLTGRDERAIGELARELSKRTGRSAAPIAALMPRTQPA